MPRNKKIQAIFSKCLAERLLERYNKIPSAAFIAKEFNLRALDVEPISQESARKWLRGLAVPELNKLFILQSWLQIDLNALNVYSEELSKYKNVSSDNSNLSNKKLFLKKTDSLKKMLSVIMKDIADLEKEIIKK